jgi:16S rRNA G966 N2-methylase RsmD
MVVRVPRTDPVYNCHAYLTKIPIDAIKPFIETLSEPGDVIVDFFAGSGMTGIAAASVGRVARLSDISVLGQHIGRGYLSNVSPTRVRREADVIISRAREAIGDLYQTRRVSDGASVELIRTIWSFVYVCPGCDAELVYFEHLDASGRPPASCPKCEAAFTRRAWTRVEDVPVRVVVNGVHGKQVEQAVEPQDVERIARALMDPRQADVPSLRIDEAREMFGRSGLGRAGLSETKQFFSSRNALALLELWKAVNGVSDSSVRQKLAFAFTACLTRASRRYQWGPKRPLNAQNQTYYIAPVYFEWNVFELFARKVEAALRSDEAILAGAPLFNHNFSERVTYTTASADKLTHLDDSSVDYVFTDPPFGSNIFYADMHLFHEAWLGRVTDDASEAVMHTSGPRKRDSAGHYERVLRGAFAEAFRVLKPGRFMTVVFGNSSGAVWALVQRALRETGFSEPCHVAILDKGQRSVKGLNSGSEGVVTVDLVLTMQKPDAQQMQPRSAPSSAPRLADLIAAAGTILDPEHARNPSYLYVAALREAIRLGHRVDDLHYSDVLVGLRGMGFAINAKNGLLAGSFEPEPLARIES